MLSRAPGFSDGCDHSIAGCGFRKGSIFVGGLWRPCQPAWEARPEPPQGLGWREYPYTQPLHNDERVVVAMWVLAYCFPKQVRDRWWSPVELQIYTDGQVLLEAA